MFRSCWWTFCSFYLRSPITFWKYSPLYDDLTGTFLVVVGIDWVTSVLFGDTKSKDGFYGTEVLPCPALLITWFRLLLFPLASWWLSKLLLNLSFCMTVDSSLLIWGFLVLWRRFFSTLGFFVVPDYAYYFLPSNLLAWSRTGATKDLPLLSLDDEILSSFLTVPRPEGGLLEVGVFLADKCFKCYC